MKGKSRHLHCECGEEAEEKKQLLSRVERNSAGTQSVRELDVIKGVGLAVQVENGAQHEYGAKERINEKLDRGRTTLSPAPSANHQVHRNERDFPKDVEDEQINGGEDTDQAELEQEQERVEVLVPRLDHALRDPNGNWQHES